MLNIIKNTLHIICELTNSNSAFLLESNNGINKIISSYTQSKSLIFQKSFLEYLKKECPQKSELKRSSKIIDIMGEYFFESYYSKDLVLKPKKICLLLFASKKNNYTKDKINIINNLAKLLKKDLATILAGIDNFQKNDISKINFPFDVIFELAFDSVNDLIFFLDKDGRFLNINPSAVSHLNYNLNEIKSKHFIDIVSTKKSGQLVKSFSEIIRQKSRVTFSTVLISKFFKEIELEVIATPFLNGNNIEGLILYGKNITELQSYAQKMKDSETKLIEAQRIISIERMRSKRQKAFLEEMNKMKKDFISNISHELRTPLASIIGFTETIYSEPNMDNEMRNEFIQIILNEGKRLAKLVNELLDISHFEETSIKIIKSSFNISNLMLEAIKNNQTNINKKKIILSHEIQDENVILNGDKEKIFQVIDSILKNSIKYTEEEGRIYITSQSLFREFEISISDTGIGIPENNLKTIFQKFQRINFIDKNTEETGLSLVLIKQIVDLHKGFISIQSNENKGTSVIVKFPRELNSSIN